MTVAARILDLAVADDGRFLLLADDGGFLTCVNRTTLAILWRRRVHAAAVSAVGMVGIGVAQRAISIDRQGHCVLTDPSTGHTVDAWPLPGCQHDTPHSHPLDVTVDKQHVIVGCREPRPPEIARMVDAAAAHGLTVNIHDQGGHVVLLDLAGAELARTDTINLPFAAGARTRVAYLRAPDHWVGVRDVVTGEEEVACLHDFERGGYAVAFSPDERWVAWSGYEKYDATMIIREVPREFVRLVDVSPPVSCGIDVLSGEAKFTTLCFSPNSRLLAAGDTDGAVTVVDVAEPERPPRLLGGVAGSVAALAFADGGAVVALGTPGEICSWPIPKTPR